MSRGRHRVRARRSIVRRQSSASRQVPTVGDPFALSDVLIRTGDPETLRNSAEAPQQTVRLRDSNRLHPRCAVRMHDNRGDASQFRARIECCTHVRARERTEVHQRAGISLECNRCERAEQLTLLYPESETMGAPSARGISEIDRRPRARGPASAAAIEHQPICPSFQPSSALPCQIRGSHRFESQVRSRGVVEIGRRSGSVPQYGVGGMEASSSCSRSRQAAAAPREVPESPGAGGTDCSVVG